jgi:uncharacterized protein (DUF362 family)
MSNNCDRRKFLGCSLGAAGLLVGSGLPDAHSASTVKSAGEGVDLSDKAPSTPVAIQRCESFEPKLVRRKIEAALDLIGGVDQLVRNKTVTIKINLTGMNWKPFAGMPAYESYQTHPHTVGALCAILNDAGAKRIVIIENLYWSDPFEEILINNGWDVAMIESAGGHKVTFEDTRNKGKFSGYSRFKVPWGGFMYPAFDLNQRFEKTDVFVSLSKLKQHACAGVTMTIKNMFGNTPCSLYGNDAPGENALTHRSDMFHNGKTKPPAGVPQELDHGLEKHWKYRIPRITSDVYGARPVDLTIIDGIRTISGGEGYWNRGVKLQEPKVLLAGRNGVCADAVGTAVMGFDPMANHMEHPFPGENHLRFLASKGMGTNDLSRIEVVGLPLKKALYPFDKKKADEAKS